MSFLQKKYHSVLLMHGFTLSNDRIVFDMAFPLVRVDDEKWLKEYRKGKIFLRNQLYYQSMDLNDIARCDVFDGAIPAQSSKFYDPIIRRLPTGANTNHSRIMNLNVFISCLFAFEEANMFRVSEDEIRLSLSEENKEAIKAFRKDSALIIFDRYEFERRVYDAAQQSQIPCIIGNINYQNLFNQDTPDLLEYEISNEIRPANEIPFTKDVRFFPQQEYRICCEFKGSIADPAQQDMFFLSDSVKYQHHFLVSVSFEDISVILPIEFAINHDIVINRAGIRFTSE